MHKLALSLFLALSTPAFAQVPDLTKLPGEYKGVLPDMNSPCQVSISQEGLDYSVRTQVPAWGYKLAFPAVQRGDLEWKLADDATERQREGKDLDSARASFHRTGGFPTPFGWTESTSLSLHWYKGELEVVSQISDKSGGPFINPGDRVEADCFGLKKVN